MKIFNCVMLSLNNPHLTTVKNGLMSDYLNYIDKEISEKYGIKFYIPDDPHVTLIYGLTPGLGKNKLYHQIKIANYPDYKALRKAGAITIDNPVIDTFDNEDSRVLKVDLLNCNEYQLLKKLNEDLMQLPNDFKYGGDKYHPHLTLAYLKVDTPDEVIKEINDKYSKLMNNFLIGDFVLSGTEDGDKVSDFKEKFS